MKKWMKLFLLLGACMVLVLGCQKPESEEAEQEEKKTEALEIESEKEDEEDAEESEEAEEEMDKKEESGQQTPVAKTKTVTIYSSNDNADGFVTEEVEAPEVTADWLFGQLASRGNCIWGGTGSVLCRNAD